MRHLLSVSFACAVLSLAGCSALSFKGKSSKSDSAASSHESENAQEASKKEEAPSPTDNTAPTEPKAPETVDTKREENFVAEAATKNMDVIVAAESNNQTELDRINTFLKSLATKTNSLGSDLRRVYLGNFPLTSFPDAMTQYETSATVVLSPGSGLATLASALAAGDTTVAPRANTQLTLVVISPTDTTPDTFETDDDGNQKPIYPNIVFPAGTMAYGLLKMNPVDPQQGCGTQVSENQQEIVRKYGGRSFDLCDSDMETVAGFVARAITHRGRVFQLKAAPDFKKPIEVFVNDQLVDPKEYEVGQFSWTVEFPSNRTFASGDKVKVVYQVK